MSILEPTANHTQEMIEESEQVLNDVADYIKLELGAPIVDVELNDQVILKIIERSLRLLSKHNLIKLWYTAHPVNKVIDLSKLPHRVSYITEVFKSKGDSLSNTTALSSMFGFPSGLRVAKISYGTPYSNLNDITSVFNEGILLQKNLSAYKDSLSYDFDRVNNMLYIDSGLTNESSITIEYIPVMEVQDLYLMRSNQIAMDVLMKYSTGYCMISLGRARGKYSTSNYNWAQSSDELLSTGKSMISEVESYLNHNYSHVLID